METNRIFTYTKHYGGENYIHIHKSEEDLTEQELELFTGQLIIDFEKSPYEAQQRFKIWLNGK